MVALARPPFLTRVGGGPLRGVSSNGELSRVIPAHPWMGHTCPREWDRPALGLSNSLRLSFAICQMSELNSMRTGHVGGKCGCPRALPWAPRVWAPEGACAFEIPVSSLSQFIFYTKVKRDSGPPGPSATALVPSASRPLQGTLREAPPLALGPPLEGAESSMLGNWSWAPGSGGRLMAFPWDRRQGTSAEGPHKGRVLPSQLERPRRRCGRGRKEGMWLFPSPRPRAGPPRGAGHRPFTIPQSGKLSQERRRTPPSAQDPETRPQEGPCKHAPPRPALSAQAQCCPSARPA